MRLYALALICVGMIAGCNHSAAAGSDRAGDAGKLDGAAGTKAASLDAGANDEQIPATTSEELTKRAKHLIEAVAQDNPDLGADMLFPRDGYIAARDVADPGKVWDRSVITSWKKSIHRLHKKKGIDRAQFVSIELGHAVVQAVPKRKDWKKALWKVRHSKLTYVIDGKTFRIDIPEMTGWRGAWYVTKLR